jgi:hypothetical protein
MPENDLHLLVGEATVRPSLLGRILDPASRDVVLSQLDFLHFTEKEREFLQSINVKTIDVKTKDQFASLVERFIQSHYRNIHS